MSFTAEQLGHFKTLASIRTPRPTLVLAVMLLVGMVASTIFLLTVPWVQTAQGTGAVIALDPRDRVQNITALVNGRVERWYVTDGAAVKKDDPIALVVDNDPRYLERLQSERTQAAAEIAAAQSAMAVARLDVNRMGALYREGLAARRDLELAQIKVADYAGKIAAARAAINRIDTSISRQSTQLIRAPRDGRILRVEAIDSATMVSQGDVLATFAPEESRRIVELFVDGRDVPLIRAGRKVRLEFEGWPAIQFSGWPAVARGMFDGRVYAVDLSASPNGLFRVLVEPDPTQQPWPSEPFVRLGAKARGWVLMDTVTVGFELWRQLNDFPLQWQRPRDGTKSGETGNATAAR